MDYYTPEEEKFARIGADAVILIPIDMPKLNAAINEHYQGIEPNAEIVYNIHETIAVIKGINYIVEDDACGQIMNDDAEPYQMDIYKHKIINGKKCMSIIPENVIGLSISAMLEHFALPETTLAQFMGHNFGYNRRKISNTEIVIKEAARLYKEQAKKK